MRIYVYVHMCIYVYVHMYMCARVCVCVCARACVKRKENFLRSKSVEYASTAISALGGISTFDEEIYSWYNSVNISIADEQKYKVN